MVSGQYAFSNKEEKDNMGLQWGSTKNVLKVVTEINGTHSSIFSWRDKSKNHTEVRYLGLGVQKNSTEVNRTKERHLNWKLRGKKLDKCSLCCSYGYNYFFLQV